MEHKALRVFSHSFVGSEPPNETSIFFICEFFLMVFLFILLNSGLIIAYFGPSNVIAPFGINF